VTGIVLPVATVGLGVASAHGLSQAAVTDPSPVGDNPCGNALRWPIPNDHNGR